MKSLAWLSEQVLADCGTRCGVDPSRDLLTIARRVKNEGDSFLTITLPTFDKAFLKALDTGRLDPAMIPSFGFHRGLPRFLGGFLSKVFDANGQLLDNPCLDCIASIRQICRLHAKVELPCTKRRERKAEQAYIECEHELERLEIPDDFRKKFRRVAGIIMSDIFRDVPFGDPYEDLKPRHGPGATQEKILGNSKYIFKTWHTRLEDYFPFTEFAVSSPRALTWKSDPLERVSFIEPLDEPPVRVVFVPKTLKAPRVIAIEPVCMQYIQQSLLQFLVPLVERGSYTGGQVNFTRQTVNQELALLHSKDRRLATMDLSEASDRVHCLLVHDLLDCVPVFRDMVFACRSTRATTPSGVTLTLNKFASMGSALCFPMEALVFFTTIVLSRIQKAKLPITSDNVRKYSKDVYVYGDDIIIPSDETPSIRDDLELIGLKVNIDKTFYTGRFRESCGMDAFDGVDITPVYCRQISPANRRSHKGLISWVAMANQFYERGLWSATRMVRAFINKMMKVPLPFDTKDAPGLAWISFSQSRSIQRWSKTLHRFEMKQWVVVPSRYRSPLVGEGALLKCLITSTDKYRTHLGYLNPMMRDAKHLSEAIRRGALTLKHRWTPA